MVRLLCYSYCPLLKGLHGTLEKILDLHPMCLFQVGYGSEGCPGLVHSGNAECTATRSLHHPPEILGRVGAGMGRLCVCEV